MKRFTLDDLEWPKIPEPGDAPDKWDDFITVEHADDEMVVTGKMEFELRVPHDVLRDSDNTTPANVTALVMERVLLDLALELVPELHDKLKVALERVTV